jgi:aryl-alcohol dehydrogenase-like predicted oxidoreductase
MERRPKNELPTVNGSVESVQAEDSDDSIKTCRVTWAIDVTSLGLPSRDTNSAFTADIDESDTQNTVQRLQQCVDAGLQTFQLKSSNQVGSDSAADQSRREWGEEKIFGGLFRSTPRSVLRLTQRVVSIPFSELIGQLVTQNNEENKNNAFRADDAVRPWKRFDIRVPTRLCITRCLRRIGGEAIDCLQIQFLNGIEELPDAKDLEFYFLDTLDLLSEFQREGLLHLVQVQNLPRSWYTSIFRANLHHVLDAAQFDWHLAKVRPFSEPAGRRFSSTGDDNIVLPTCGLIVAGPLLGGLLTDRYLGHEFAHSVSSIESPSCRFHMKTTLPEWERRIMDMEKKKRDERRSFFSSATRSTAATRLGAGVTLSYWARYQSTILTTLQFLSRKHQVSMAAVAMRWTLQDGSTAARGSFPDPLLSVVVASRFGLGSNDENNSLSKWRQNRIRAARQVFTFALDANDLGLLRDMAGWDEPSAEETDGSFDVFDHGRFPPTSSGLLLPLS